jgi:hypothetical protein
LTTAQLEKLTLPWWQIDLTYYVRVALAQVGLVWDLVHDMSRQGHDSLAIAAARLTRRAAA